MTTNQHAVLSITGEERDILAQEIALKLQQAPVREELRDEYVQVQTALARLGESGDRSEVSRLQVDLLRNLSGSWNLQHSEFSDRITAWHAAVPENGSGVIGLL